MRHAMEHRRQRDGGIRQLPRVDPLREEASKLVNMIMTMSDEEAYGLLSTNFETGEREQPPADMASKAAKQLKLK